MKILFEFFTICVFTFLGEMLNFLIPVAVPGNVWGLILLFLALNLKIVRLEKIQNTGSFLLQAMPIMFVPILVSAFRSRDLIKDNLLSISFIVLISTIIVFLVTAFTVNIINKISKKKNITKTSRI